MTKFDFESCTYQTPVCNNAMQCSLALFRDSPVTFSSSQLEGLVLETSVGLTTRFRGGLSVSYALRSQSREIKTGIGARSLTWASVALSKQFL